MRPFSINLHSPTGTPNGILVATRDDWSGRTVIFPRTLAGQVVGSNECKRPGVYILTSSNKTYIGGGDPIGDRIDFHVKKKDYWKKGVFFTDECGRINECHVEYLVSRLTALAKHVNQIPQVKSGLISTFSISDEDRLFADEFLFEMLRTLPIFGFGQFSMTEEAAVALKIGKRVAVYGSIPFGMQFKLSSRNAEATLEVVEGGVVVKAGSRVSEIVTDRFEIGSPCYAALRRQLCESGVIGRSSAGLVFTKDQHFASGSAAAAVARGSVSNADWWINSQGKSLGEYIREAKSKL